MHVRFVFVGGPSDGVVEGDDAVVYYAMCKGELGSFVSTVAPEAIVAYLENPSGKTPHRHLYRVVQQNNDNGELTIRAQYERAESMPQPPTGG